MTNSNGDPKVLVGTHAKWVKSHLYCALSGHTMATLRKMRNKHVYIEGIHYKSGPEGPESWYYNVEAIDKLITRHRVRR